MHRNQLLFMHQRIGPMKKTIRIGTRGSKLALWQANHVKDKIEGQFPDLEVKITTIKTTGDMIVDRPLSMVGGKGLFVKEIEKALLESEIDMAVHSMKDMPGELPPGLVIGAVPARENPFDVLISNNNLTLAELQKGQGSEPAASGGPPRSNMPGPILRPPPYGAILIPGLKNSPQASLTPPCLPQQA